MNLYKINKSFSLGALFVFLLLSLLFSVGEVDAALANGEKFVGQIIASSVPSNFAN